MQISQKEKDLLWDIAENKRSGFLTIYLYVPETDYYLEEDIEIPASVKDVTVSEAIGTLRVLLSNIPGIIECRAEVVFSS